MFCYKETLSFALFYATKHLENQAIEKHKRMEFFVLSSKHQNKALESFPAWKLIATLFVRV